ncbi:MAG: putative manganese-dependent inorganic diphosphatase [Erysipelothrix sp.]|nr:putative manganese-dependent inorganic diphosphatase [Erysipelothrix sp.]
MKHPIIITGHRNPDSDSVCSALAYGELKKQLGYDVLPIRLGHINSETAYILNRFEVKPPKLMRKLETLIKDITIDDALIVTPEATIKEAWDLMRDHDKKAITIVDKDNKLEGIATLGTITDGVLSLIKNNYELMRQTPYQNIASAVWGEVLIAPRNYNPSGIISISSGVLVDKKEISYRNKIVLVSTREHSQIKAIETGASLLVVCFAKRNQISDHVKEMAEKHGTGIIYTTLDLFTTSQTITQAVPIKLIMTTDLVTFNIIDNLEEVKTVINKSRYRSYPVVDSLNQVQGFISRYHLWNHERINLILVDHNETNQSIPGIEEANVIEIIDHHRLGDIETNSPVMFRNEIIGSTSSIIAKIYRENNITPTREMAGIMLGAIISDTMNFNSPTSTPQDEEIGKYLASLIDIDIEEYADKIFEASATLSKKTLEEVVLTDFKEFMIEGFSVAISQINIVDSDYIFEIKDDLITYLHSLCINKAYDIGLVMITDIKDKGSYMVVAGPQAHIFEYAFEGQKEMINDLLFIEGVLSRKKQIIPNIASAINKYRSI